MADITLTSIGHNNNNNNTIKFQLEMLQPRNETVLAEQLVGVLDAHKVLVTQLLILSHKTESYMG